MANWTVVRPTPWDTCSQCKGAVAGRTYELKREEKGTATWSYLCRQHAVKRTSEEAVAAAERAAQQQAAERTAKKPAGKYRREPQDQNPRVPEGGDDLGDPRTDFRHSTPSDDLVAIAAQILASL